MHQVLDDRMNTVSQSRLTAWLRLCKKQSPTRQKKTAFKWRVSYWWAYDDLGRVISESIQIGTQANPTSVSRAYYYDSLSNLVQSVDRNGRLIRYDYDDLHLLQTERWYAPAANPSDPTDAGALQGGYDYDFDTLGRLVSIAEMTQPSAEHRYQYRYDEGSRLVAELSPAAGPGAIRPSVSSGITTRTIT